MEKVCSIMIFNCKLVCNFIRISDDDDYWIGRKTTKSKFRCCFIIHVAIATTEN